MKVFSFTGIMFIGENMKYIKIILLIIIIYSAHTLIESIIIENQIYTFKQKAVYEKTINGVNYYKVSGDDSISPGDSFVSRKSGNDNMIIADIISFYVGGHAAFLVDENTTIEIYGNLDSDNIVMYQDNDWIETEIEVVGLKIDSEVLAHEKYLGQTYNWFPFYDNPNKRYCTDLLNKIYTQNINYDFGITTVNDIIISRRTKIILYKETIYDEINIYYMG